METRPRLISPAFWSSESVGDLTYRQRALFVGIITNADDQGRLKDRAALLRAQVFPYDDISFAEIRADLQAVARMGGVHLYDGLDGKPYIQVVKWWKFQHPSYSKPSRFPAPDGWQDGWNYKTNANQMSTHNWPKSGSDTRGYTGGYTVPNTHPYTGENTGDKVKESKVTESKIKESNIAAATAPKVEKPDPLTAGQRGFLDLFGAKRFKTVAARDAILELEQAHGTTKLLGAGRWAAENQMSVGKAVRAVRSALPKWNEPKLAKDQEGLDTIKGWINDFPD